jgi:mycothiol synthase
MSSSALQPDRAEGTEVAKVLSLVLAEPGAGVPAGPSVVQSFEQYLRDTGTLWEALRIRGPTALIAAAVVLLPRGRTMLLMLPAPGELGIEAAAELELVRAILDAYAAQRLHFAQALIPPQALSQRRLLEAAGFRKLAPLVYLQRELSARHPESGFSVAGGEWVTFSAQTRGEFAATILGSYEGSQDCPELAGLRPIEDILAGHESAGRFEPQLWQLLRINGEAAGCILLAPLFDGQSAELVYMGVRPEFRRSGVGSALLRHAIEQCERRRIRRLTLAVDDRNEPAKRLYARFSFVPMARRDAYLYRWPHFSAQRPEAG